MSPVSTPSSRLTNPLAHSLLPIQKIIEQAEMDMDVDMDAPYSVSVFLIRHRHHQLTSIPSWNGKYRPHLSSPFRTPTIVPRVLPDFGWIPSRIGFQRFGTGRIPLGSSRRLHQAPLYPMSRHTPIPFSECPRSGLCCK